MGGIIDLPSVVGRIYDTVLDPEAWTATLEAIVDAVHGNHANIITQRPTYAVDFGSAVHVDPAHFAAIKAALETGVAAEWLQMLPPGAVVPGTALVPQSVLVRTDFFNDYIRPMDGYYSAVARTFAAPQASGYMAVCRPQGAGDFDDGEIAWLQQILPHCGAAMRLRHRLAEAEGRARHAHAALDGIEVGVILLDRAGVPLFVNRAAEAIVGENDGLRLGRSGLAAATASDTRRLHRLIASACASATLARTGPLRLCLPRPSLRRPLVVRAMPVGGTPNRTAEYAGGVALFVHDPERHVRIDEAAVASTFGLTPREASVAAMLARGAELTAIAEALGLALGTVRTHLKHVFAKTRTRRQGELVHLVLNLRL